jgi:DNA-binding NtrC family response regulator
LGKILFESFLDYLKISYYSSPERGQRLSPAAARKKRGHRHSREPFLRKMAARHGKKIAGFKPDTVACLEAHSWPGNVRELENVVERMVILAEQNLESLPQDLLPQEIRPRVLDELRARRSSHNVKSVKENYEKIILREALTKHNWNQSSVARALGISERTVRYKMQKFGIKKP